MGKRRTYSTLDGHTEVYEEPKYVGGSPVYLKIDRHMPKKGKTYFQYYFANPRNNSPTKDHREPDVYRYHFRIFWKETGPVLYGYRVHHNAYSENCERTEWREADKHNGFNLFPNYTEMIQKIQSIITEHYLLVDHTESK